MANYATIPDEVQPAAKTSWRRAVAVAAAASFVLGTFALRTATPMKTKTPMPMSPSRVERKTFWGVFGKCVGLNLSV